MTDNLMAPILDKLPGYREAMNILQELEKVPMPVTSGALTPADALASEIIDRIADGKPLDLLGGAATAIAEVDSVRVAREALVRAKAQIQRQAEELKIGNPDHLLSGLNTALIKLIAEVRKLGPLHEITHEAGAIASDRTKEFKQLRAISPRYTAIRREQLRIMKNETGGDVPLPEALFAPNLREHFPLWAPWRSHGHLVHAKESRLRDISPPWPVPADEQVSRHGSVSRQTFERDASDSAFMLWAVANEVPIWVPTLDQYVEAAAEYHAALSHEHRGAVVDEVWHDPGGLSVGAPARSDRR